MRLSYKLGLVACVLFLASWFCRPIVTLLLTQETSWSGIAIRYPAGNWAASQGNVLPVHARNITEVATDPDAVVFVVTQRFKISETALILGFVGRNHLGVEMRVSTVGSDLLEIQGGPGSWQWFYLPSLIGPVRFHCQFSDPGKFPAPGFDITTEVLNRFGLTKGQQLIADLLQYILAALASVVTIWATVIHNAARSGRLPLTLLRRFGFPGKLMPGLMAQASLKDATQFCSCFISYSTRDQEFAKRLHSDLRSEGVRCWFAPEDLRIGDRFQDRIEESIRIFDKVMVVLSEASVESRWVEREVNAAREREERENRLILFPIRIDGAVIHAPQAWAADLRRGRHIGEFHDWHHQAAYRTAFDRLLRDLKSGV
jgi:hypothetical protein